MESKGKKKKFYDKDTHTHWLQPRALQGVEDTRGEGNKREFAIAWL